MTATIMKFHHSRPASPRQAAKPEPVEPPPSAGSGTLSPAAFPQAVAPEPTPVTPGSGALIQSSAVIEPVVARQVAGDVALQTSLAARGSEESAAPFTPPAFLLKDSKPYVLRPHCAHPDNLGLCAGVGSKHCHECSKAIAGCEVAA